MSDVDIRCTPGDGILHVSADTIAALDRLGQTLTDPLWRIELEIPGVATLTARPTNHRQETDE